VASEESHSIASPTGIELRLRELLEHANVHSHTSQDSTNGDMVPWKEVPCGCACGRAESFWGSSRCRWWLLKRLKQISLPGRYDFTLRWTFDVSREGDPGAPPSLFTAIKEQLGLRMDAVKGPAEVFVIDHLERPSEN
jgi:hypothetical protein